MSPHWRRHGQLRIHPGRQRASSAHYPSRYAKLGFEILATHTTRTLVAGTLFGARCFSAISRGAKQLLNRADRGEVNNPLTLLSASTTGRPKKAGKSTKQSINQALKLSTDLWTNPLRLIAKSYPAQGLPHTKTAPVSTGAAGSVFSLLRGYRRPLVPLLGTIQTIDPHRGIRGL